MTFEEVYTAQQSGNAQLAEQGYRQLLEQDPQYVLAALNLGALLISQGRLGEAIGCYQGVLAHSPNHLGVLNNLANTLQVAGQIEQALRVYQQVLQQAKPPLAYRIASNYLTSLQYHPGLDDGVLCQAAAELGRQFGQEQSLETSPSQDIIRIGFVSADLCDHPVGFFLLPLLAQLDRSRFHPVLYANGGRQDDTARGLCFFAEWHDIVDLDHDAVRELIRAHRIDLLFDLAGHTSGNRLPVFAARAAPVQASWLGYFATSGVPAMDYVLMDPWHAPPGAEAQFTECLLRFPHSRFCYEPVPFAPEVSPPPCLARGYVTFGSFNNTAKLNQHVLAVWAEILRCVPDSRLVLKWRTFADAECRQAVLERFVAAGVAPERIELRGQSFHRQLLEEYADIDIALDPFPFCGGQTSCEALWMGLPVVTLPGTRPVSRQPLCFLGNIGLAELAASDQNDYVARAVALANDRARLQSLRHGLRNKMRASPLMDAKAFAADFAALTEWMLKDKQHGIAG